ncbi:signal peptidase I [Acidaminobacter hydrogenoformans]|uniref:Signal peptidase I n=1 Tax=Acidaminobacter hydrogenoformans DSM 2784 TaxID=1120920 RepID=A0A1G5RYM5_9FIRM|nr:signal peptidase I [Acidaminobacter hydrogenoformans]SCZ79224.1 signal peptidase I [Acidaminobacter hydrogenoformans DSM 2784]
MKNEIFEWLKSFAVAIIIVLVFNVFFATTVVYSTSMYPTLIEKDILLLRRSSDVKSGDIVSFRTDLTLSENDIASLNPIQKIFASVNPGKNLIKRVIGLPGDTIDIVGGEVYINGEKLQETYVSSNTNGDVHIKSIPDGKYFLMGDNRAVSLDSRDSQVGLIDGEKIIGKAIFRLYPLTRFGDM